MKSFCVVLVLLCGCIGPDLTSDPAIDLGTGEVEFEVLADGDSVPLVSGLQGGRHVWGSVRVVGIDWREIDMLFSIEDGAGELLTDTTRVVQELQQCDTSAAGCADGMGEMVGITILVDNEDAGSIANQSVVLRVEASDVAGRTASSTRGVDVTF